MPIPQIQHLFAFKPDRTDHLSRFTQGVMRGPSPLLPGQRELIAALTSKLNQCLF
jgi:alkylhydroperoxidase family enzyme